MSIEAVVLQEVINNGKELARLQGEKDAYQKMSDSFMDLIKMVTPIVATFIQADMTPNPNTAVESARREFQSKTDRMESQIRELKDLVNKTS